MENIVDQLLLLGNSPQERTYQIQDTQLKKSLWIISLMSWWKPNTENASLIHSSLLYWITDMYFIEITNISTVQYYILSLISLISNLLDFIKFHIPIFHSRVKTVILLHY